MEIRGHNSFDAWVQAVALVRGEGTNITDPRKTRELLNLLITIHSCDNIEAPINFLSSCKRWVYPTLREIENIILAKNSQKPYSYSYGARIFKGEHSQIHDYIIPLLKSHPQTRRACVMVTNEEDARITNAAMSSVLAIDFKIRAKKLHATMFIRSSDVFIGWPANIYQLFALTEYIADRIDVPIGSLSTLATSAHLFLEYEGEIKRLLSR